MSNKNIIIKGAREHNLKNIHLELPRNKLIVFTGISGSGKSSLAFDTIYAEGQRRYVESLSAYARQFLEQMEKPDVDEIEGLSPAISIDQKGTSRNPRSTVGTVTEIYDYLRLLYARIGLAHCYKCGKPIVKQTVQQIVDQVMNWPKGTKFQVLAPVVRGRKGEYSSLIEDIRKKGFVRVRVDGSIYDADEPISLDKNKRHYIEVVVDRLVLQEEVKGRLTDSIETAMNLGERIAMLKTEGEEVTFSEQFACLDCGISLEEITPRMFSFNSPYGACPTCSGLGDRREFDPTLVISRPDLSLADGAIAPIPGLRGWYFFDDLESFARQKRIPLDKPFQKLNQKQQRLLLYGDENGDYYFEGIIPCLSRRYRETHSDHLRFIFHQYMSFQSCPSCQGKRLRPESLAVTIGGLSIAQFCEMSIKEALVFLNELKLRERELLIGERVIREIRERLQFLINVGLDYITLDRSAASLSGGEAQRIRLATQIGSGLVGVLYILDEPSIGLHQRDNRQLLETLRALRDLGNTLIVVEHDEATIRSADYIVDIGVGAGEHGGEIVVAGTVDDVIENPHSITGAYLGGRERIEIPEKRRRPLGPMLIIRGAEEHNLKEIDVGIPLGLLVCITGVSGSGKSTLVDEVLYHSLARIIYHSKIRPGKHRGIEGIENIDKVININQSPIGRTPRSNSATYTGTFTPIRELFTQTGEAKIRGYKPGRFSFNVRGGRCEACEGDGTIKIEMQFLPNVYIKCDECKGKRFNRETLEVRFKGKNISDVLEMSIEEALEFFGKIPPVQRHLQTLYDVGLEYIKLGQSAPTLSGGEAQRVKLASELSKKATGRTLYILDEPTTGLHFDDIKKLLNVLNRLVDAGNTVVVIEHNLDVVKTADWIIDLGPEGGEDGGFIIAQGSPEDVAKVKRSYTGHFLKLVLNNIPMFV